jgi:Fe2+ or Zn2+ uptake regulation protein
MELSNTYIFVRNLRIIRIMQANDIKEIGRQLKIRRKMRDLLEIMREKRHTLSPDTLYRAFNMPDQHTELLQEIRTTGKLLVDNCAAIDAAFPTGKTAEAA